MTAEDNIRNLVKSCGRPGVSDLLSWLDGTDFWTAPASTQYHGSKPGGLAEHSLGVAKHLKTFNEAFECGMDRDQVILLGIFHDVCKVNFYTTEKRNRKNKQGNWESYDFYTVDDKFPAGHGEKSVFIISRFVQLTDEEILAIRWHMGAHGLTDFAATSALSKAMHDTRFTLALHTADMVEASRAEIPKK